MQGDTLTYDERLQELFLNKPELVVDLPRWLLSSGTVEKYRSFQRLAVVEIDLPPLRERMEDIPLLISYFLNYFNEKNHKTIKGLTAQCHNILMKYPWPGNVRELRNVIERAVILSTSDRIDVHVLPERILSYKFEKPTIMIPLGTTVEEAEKQLILRTLEMENNNKTRAAQIVGISLKTLHNKLGKYGKDED